MKTNRRHFLSTSFVGALAATALPRAARGAAKASAPAPLDLPARYAQLDAVLKQPVLRRDLFPAPVILDSIELLRDRNNFLCRVRSRDGVEGISVGHGNQNAKNWPTFKGLIDRCQGKDARDLDSWTTDVPGKNGGIPYNVQLATLEIAILDLLGNTAKKPIAALLGKIINPQVEVYHGSRISELLNLPPEKSLELVRQDLALTNAKAIKIRAGGPGPLDSDSKAGTEKLIRLTRETFGDQMVLGCDGNNKYSVKGGIRLGKILESYNYSWWEEMVPCGWYDELRLVTEALQIPVTTGESEAYLSTFRWLVAHAACDIVQPDTLYFGGMTRAVRVARMAGALGLTYMPHITQYGLGYLYMLPSVAVAPNASRFQEFDGFSTRDANGDEIPIQSKAEPFTIKDGVLKVPTGPGLGLIIDPAYINKHRVVTAW
jgi:L-alanine-DL-glutamate epimerase-like enolase superfamily enzyme